MMGYDGSYEAYREKHITQKVIKLNELSTEKRVLWKEIMDLATSGEIDKPEVRKKHDRLREEYIKLSNRQRRLDGGLPLIPENAE